MSISDNLKKALQLLAIISMAVPIIFTVFCLMATEPFSLEYFHIGNFTAVILPVVFGILLPLTLMIFSIRRVKQGKGVLLLFIAVVLCAVITVPSGLLVTTGDCICSYTDDADDYGVYDNYVSERLAGYDGDELLPPQNAFGLSEYQYKYCANDDCFYIYTVMHFDTRADYEAQTEKLASYELEYDGAYDCRVSSADETNQLAAIWKASDDDNTITMMLIYDHYHSGYDRMMELQHVDELFDAS